MFNFSVSPMEWEIIFRLFVATILGGLVGYQRERHDRPAGVRTHSLVCIGSALIMVISAYGFSDFTTVTKDPARLAAQVVSGIGFLGAGTIISDGFSIKGLTTAASLWIVAGIGLAVGSGMIFIAVVSTLFVYIVLAGFLHHNYWKKSHIEVKIHNSTCSFKTLLDILEKYHISPDYVEVRSIDATDKKMNVLIEINRNTNTEYDQIICDINNEIKNANIE